MKKLYLLALTLIVVAVNLNAQKLETKDLPAPVLSKFNVFYPTIKKVKWEKKTKGYAAHFKDVDSKKVNVLFSNDGSLIEKEWKASKDDLTDAVIETIQKRFKDYKIEEILKVEKGGSLFYKVLMSKKEKEADIKYETFFTDYGGLVSNEVVK